MRFNIRSFFELHLLIMVYSFGSLLSKAAGGVPFASVGFVLMYGGVLIILFVYAIFWQQLLKRLPLTVMIANKAATVVWGIIWGVLFFSEQVTLHILVAAALIIVGIFLCSGVDIKGGFHHE